MSIAGCVTLSRCTTRGTSDRSAEPAKLTRSVPVCPSWMRRALCAARSRSASTARASRRNAVAGRRHLHAPARPREELAAQLVLQQPDLVAQRRLGHVEPLGRAAEVQLLGDRHEVAELTQLH